MKRALSLILGLAVSSAAEEKTQTFSLGGIFFDIPAFLATHDDDGELVAYPSKSDFANLRFSVLSIRKEGNLVAGAGVDIIRRRAREEMRELHEEKGRVWYSYTEPANDGPPGSTMTYWYVGMDSHAIVISCYLDAKDGTKELKDRVRNSVMPTIQSFRSKEKNG